MTPLAALHYQVAINPDGTAFIDGWDRWTYSRLLAEVERVARGLADRGVRSGVRVALHLPNRPELAIALYACFHVGAIAVPLNIRLKTAEITRLLQRVEPALYVGHSTLYESMRAIENSVLPIDSRFVAGELAEGTAARPWHELASDGAPVALASKVHTPALLLATAGTTGLSKFVIHTPASLGASVDRWEHFGFSEPRAVILACPMVHASGLFTFLASIFYGNRMVLLDRFDPDAVLDAIETHRCSWMLGLPFMYAALLERQRVQPRNVDSLRFCLSGGDVCSLEIQREFPIVFGVPLRSAWASTEAVGSLTYGLGLGPFSRIAKDAEVRLVDEAGNPVSPGAVGELLVRGPHVSIGYWAGPDAIQDPPAEGWFRTGDLMRQDEKGDLWFLSRKKDLMIRGGSNISPLEVERVLAAHPAIKEAAVVGVPDETLGQRVIGFVTLKNGAGSHVVGDVMSAARTQLADYKLPEHLRVITAIPRNALGKTDRKALVELILEQSSVPPQDRCVAEPP